MDYEWDEDKAASNLAKHGISFPEATTVFLDPLAMTFADPDHSLGEIRFVTIGRSASNRALVVAHVELSEERLRIISARRASKREAHAFEEI